MLQTAPNLLLDALRKHPLLEPGPLQELVQLAESAGHDAQRLAQYAVRRGWLTAYQASALLHGRGAELELGHYVLLDRLGQGGMAVVYKARNRMLGRMVALKVIRPDLLAKRGSVQRFRREVQAAALLSHPNIVLALDADEVAGLHFFVMEYVDGLNLGHLVKRRGPLAVAQACDFVRQAALGLAHAHAKGLVHRDIKPSNLMLTHGPGSKAADTIKILDLGLARLQLPDGPENGDLTCAGAMIGTPEYVSPEQAADPHAADVRSDLYSLGCTFYYLLAGQVPFPGNNVLEKLFKHRMEPARPLAELRGDVPPPVAAIVEKLMAKLPEDRYQTAAELAATLQELPAWPMPSSAITVTRPSMGAGAKPSAVVPAPRRRRALLLSFLTVLMLAGIAGMGAAVYWYGGESEAVETSPQPLSGEQAAAQALGRLLARADDARVDARQLRQDVVGFRTQFPWSPTRVRAAELLRKLPSPFDGLNAQSVPAEVRFDGQPGGELVMVIGDGRLRHGGAAWSVAFAPDGKSLVSGGDDRMVYQWDASNGNRLRMFAGAGAPITALAWSPDGKTVVAGCHDWAARLLDMPSGVERAVLRHQGNVRAVAISGDSRLVATGAHPDPGKNTGVIRLWNMEGKELFRLDGHHGAVLSLAFAPHHGLLASGGEDKTIRIWDLKQKKEVAQLNGHQGSVLALDYSADGHSLASGSADKTLRLWDVGQKKERTGARDLGHGVGGVSFVPKSTLLAVSSHDGVLRLFDLTNGQEKGTLRQHGGAIALSVAADGQSAATTAFDGSVRLWDLAKQKDVPMHRKLSPVQSLAVAPDDRTFVTGHQGGRLRFWDVATGKELANLEKHQHGVQALAYSPDGKLLLSGGWDHQVMVWDVGQRKVVQQLRGHRGPVAAAAFSPDGTLAATASHDKTARLWDPVTGADRGTLLGHTQALHALAFSPDGRLLATGANERVIKLWELEPLRERTTFSVYSGESLVFLPDGKSLISGSGHGAIYRWDTASRAGAGRAVEGLNLGWARALALSPDGQILALAGNDGRLLLWDIATGKERRSWRVPGMATDLAFSGDGRHLLCVLNQGTLCVFRLTATREGQ